MAGFEIHDIQHWRQSCPELLNSVQDNDEEKWSKNRWSIGDSHNKIQGPDQIKLSGIDSKLQTTRRQIHTVVSIGVAVRLKLRIKCKKGSTVGNRVRGR